MKTKPLNQFVRCSLLCTMILGCATEPTDRLNLLFEGDSDIELWNIEGYEQAKNIGVGGATCQDVLNDISETLEAYPTRKMVLVCGENDLGDRSVEETFSLFKSIVEKVLESNSGVVYMGTKPEPETVDLHEAYREYDTLIRQYAVDVATISAAPLVMVDVYNSFEDLGNPTSLYAEDQLHLSEEGYAYWNQWLDLALRDESCVIWQNGSCTRSSLD